MITVLGSINIDLVARTSRLPGPGETVAGNSSEILPGGKGANQALAARRAGAQVRMVGAVGQDMFAEHALSFLKKDGVVLDAVRRTEGATGTALIMIGGDGENMIAVVPGANGMLRREDVDDCLAAMQAGELLMMQMEIPEELVRHALIAARGLGLRTLLNIAPATSDIGGVASLADIVVANESEFELLVGGALESRCEQEDALRRLHRQTGQTIVVTLGSAGAMAIADGTILKAPGLAITPVDTVGAGDTFCGYFAVGLERGDNLQTALTDAAIAGSLACLRPGAQAGMPERSELLSTT